MKLIKEDKFEFEDSYGAIYSIDNNIQKIVFVNDINKFELEDISTKGILEIRNCDFEVSFERLIFYDGLFDFFEDEYEGRRRINLPSWKANLEEFAREFQPIFESNQKLKQYLPSVFKELIDYFK